MQLVAKWCCTFASSRDMWQLTFEVDDEGSWQHEFLRLASSNSFRQDRPMWLCSIRQLILGYPVSPCSMSWWMCYSTIGLCQMGASCVDNIRLAIMMAWLTFQLQYAVEGETLICVNSLLVTSPVARILAFILWMQFYIVLFACFSQIVCDVCHFIPA
jgi:hypothetical protein